MPTVRTGSRARAARRGLECSRAVPLSPAAPCLSSAENEDCSHGRGEAFSGSVHRQDPLEGKHVISQGTERCMLCA